MSRADTTRIRRPSVAERERDLQTLPIVRTAESVKAWLFPLCRVSSEQHERLVEKDLLGL